MATQNIIDVVIKLRRDTEANFEPVKSTFIPEKGEPVLVDTTSDGLKIKVGDGATTFEGLDYESDIIYRGYLLNGKFYTDSTYTVEIPKRTQKVYLDANQSEKMYTFNGSVFKPVVDYATASTAGLVKLYDTHGDNIDGSMTQRVVSNAIDDVKFSVSDTDAECLILNKPW